MDRPNENAVLRYVTHPEVEVDTEVPIERWALHAIGRARAVAMLEQPWIASVGRIVSSDETKAVETAEILADHLGLRVEVRPDLGENDRAATGFLPPAEFDAVVDRFFGKPEESVHGWERAIDAQRRIVSATADLFDASADRDVVVVGHGGVGTLLYCHLAGEPISRTHDQPGQGHYFSADLGSGEVLHTWEPVAPYPQG